MERRDLVWQVGGAQGEGIESAGALFLQIMHEEGYYVASHRHFMSLIKGGHTHYQVRVGSRPLLTPGDRVDILVAFDQLSIEHDADKLHEGSLVLANAAKKPHLPEGSPGRLLPVDFLALAKQAGGAIMANTVALGATGALLGWGEEALDEYFTSRFGRKGDEVVEQNRNAYRLGWEAVHKLGIPPLAMPEKPAPGRRVLLQGDEAMGWGSLEAGSRLFFAYPITPASEILQWLAKWLPKVGGAVVQAEDEIAAVNYAIGANLAGQRAWTATSGPGFSLMQEGIAIAAMTETPVVIVDAQRGGPATGLPTRPEQSDLNEILYGSHGDQPRIVISPATTADAFWAIQAAFNAAEKYQCPVIVAADLNLALDVRNVDLEELRRIPVERGQLDLEPGAFAPHTYPRFQLTDTGVSPRVLPGVPGKTTAAVGDEHTVEGHITEDAEPRVAQMTKRLKKMETAAADPELTREALWTSGPEDADLVLVGFAGTYGPIEEARQLLEAEGVPARHVHLRVLRPFPTRALAAELEGKKVLVVEQNATGQLAGELRRQLGSDGFHSCLKFDGNPFTTAEVLASVREVLAR
ncbi:MAG: 2-oxoacid:acceptor oxidoreductase subunit alpha [Bacillota bacterium]|nr:2-oxoacid:acceptor oxidoreductase subunit alpha [Bacillota bacterium]